MSEIDTFMSIHTRFALPERWMNNIEQDVAILKLYRFPATPSRRMKLRQIFAFDTNAHCYHCHHKASGKPAECVYRICIYIYKSHYPRSENHEKNKRWLLALAIPFRLSALWCCTALSNARSRKKVDRLNNRRGTKKIYIYGQMEKCEESESQRKRALEKKTKASKNFTDAVHYRVQANEVVAITHLTIRPSISLAPVRNVSESHPFI